MSADELSALFNRTLNLEPVRAAAEVEVPNEEPKIIYISTHYIQPTRPSSLSPPPADPVQPPVPQVDHTEVLQHLNQHGIETSGLCSPQLELFKNVDDSQRTLLMDYWRAAPPTKDQTQDMTTTTVEQERILANLRIERMQMLEDEAIMAQLQGEAEAAAELARQQEQEQEQLLQQQFDSDSVMSTDSTPLTPMQSPSGSWVQTSPINYMEPYMMDGYEDMARREFEASARNAMMAEGVVIKDTTALPIPVDMHPRPTYNPSHSDPVYNTSEAFIAIGNGGFMTVADWRRRREQEAERERMRLQQEAEMEMAHQYGRLYAWTGNISN